MARSCSRSLSDRDPITLSSRTRNLSGRGFGKLRVKWPVERRRNGHVLYLCDCECGAEVFVTCSNLASSHTQSCGCHQIEVTADANRKHGGTRSSLYRVWMQMRQRCCLPTAPNYKWYGARGITVCDRWMSDFSAFAKDMGERPKGGTIDRVDNDGPYEPGNCRWATSQSQQVRNSRKVKCALRVEHEGASRTLSEWENIIGVRAETIRKRIKRGWPAERALASAQQKGL